jgi:hypothetical protein
MMIRAPRGDKNYWNERVVNRSRSIQMVEEDLKVPPVVTQYEAEYLWGYTESHLMLTLIHYSRGNAIRDVYNPFPKLLDGWENSNKEAQLICERDGIKGCRAWTFDLHNLQFYQWCLWVVSLALLFEVEESQWQRLLKLIGVVPLQ